MRDLQLNESYDGLHQTIPTKVNPEKIMIKKMKKNKFKSTSEEEVRKQ